MKARENKKAFYGVFPYLATPVSDTGDILYKPLKKLVNFVIDEGVHGLTVLGSTGEFAYLNDYQREKTVALVLEATEHRVPIIAGVAHPSIREVVRQAKKYEHMGVDGILAVLETYFPLSDSQIFNYFSEISEAVNIDIVLYSNPNFLKQEISLTILEKLSEKSNIRYYKDASGNTGRLLTIMNKLGSRLKVFSASAHIPLSVIMMGGVGWMAGPACLVPRQSVLLYELATQKKYDEAIELQKKMWGINYVFSKYNLAVCIKEGLNILGFDFGRPVPPLEPLSEAGRSEIKQILEQINQTTEFDNSSEFS